jgi:DNA-binding transcriptional LysR family regulator
LTEDLPTRQVWLEQAMATTLSVGACRKAGFDPVIVQVAPQIASVITLAAAELGVAMGRASMSQLHITGVAYRAIAGEAPITPLELAYRRGETSPIVRNFHRVLRAEHNRISHLNLFPGGLHRAAAARKTAAESPLIP